MDGSQQKRLWGALALFVAAVLLYDLPGFLYWLYEGTHLDRCVHNSQSGSLQIVIMDLSRPDPWGMHAITSQLCYAMASGMALLIGWRNHGARAIGLTAVAWYLGQAADAYTAGNLFTDGFWEYGLLGGGVMMSALMIYHDGWRKTH